VGFWWAHLQWVYVENRELGRLGIYDRYAKDILRDKFYVGLERRQNWLKVILASWLVFFVFGAAIALIAGDGWREAIRMGASLLVWGVFLRTVVVWHITWSVNSLSHISGYRNYETEDFSRNNLFVGFISNGEGWHNNHHADPRSARHGHLFWEFDVTWLTILLLERLGLAKDVVRPAARLLAKAGQPAAPPLTESLRGSDS
jgi:stearoyl-CoA desaturase (delta-9 desaturase)